ncbi:DUF2079 domain-containing protein [Hymenobacter persicinus]|uniref:DUF2079 domain-containing protein n=1 Tax=Hymenobacter persicinus TaxID=2025506 RepID=A0A4Q5LBI5_9BACT|nr:DUF2079 domain-containing protein [Hymenobacter persicinus]RYU78420.1 DUF2079 domain-containing protein [Hymenobacter persicinus]
MSFFSSRPAAELRPAPGQARGQWALHLGFGLVFAAISLVNHYNFRTFALDLGMTTHALRELTHLRAPITTLLTDSAPTSFFSAHFTLIPVLVAPLYWLFGSWTLLLVQLGAVLLGGRGVWVFARGRGASSAEANLGLAYFYSLWGIYSALSFDYHDNVVGSMALPWLLHWFRQRRWAAAALAFGLLLVSKENMALLGAAVAVGAAVQYRRHPRLVLVALLGAVAAVLYFALVTKWLMPALDYAHRPFQQLVRFKHLGASLPEVIGNVLRHPGLFWQSLFVNITGDPAYDYIKLETWAVLLLSGGLALLLRPWYLLMLVPVLAQKLLSNDYGLWGINGQYSIEFAPILALAVVETARQLAAPGTRRRYLVVTLSLAALTTVVTLYVRRSKWYSRESSNFLVKRHYRSKLNVAGLHAALARVPAEASLSAQSNLAPWLTNRAKLYHFPVLGDAQYIAVLQPPAESTWPLNAEEHAALLTRLRARPNIRVVYEDSQFVLLRRDTVVVGPAAR